MTIEGKLPYNNMKLYFKASAIILSCHSLKVEVNEYIEIISIDKTSYIKRFFLGQIRAIKRGNHDFCKIL